MHPQHLGHPVVQPADVAVEGGEAADVDPGEVGGRRTVDDPLRQRPPGAAGRGDAHRVEAGADEEVRALGRLAQDELVVRGEALGPVVELLEPGVFEIRNSQQRVLHEDLEVLPILLEELEFERVGDLVRGHPGLGFRLEPADHQPADLFLEVGVAVGVAQDRQVGVHAGDGFGDHVEVLGGIQRHVHPRHGADGLRPLAGAVDHDLGFDVAGVGAHAGHPRTVGEHIEHADVLEHLGPTLPRPLGQRHRQVGGVGLAVGG
jgi:hypothetical protein